MRLLCTPFSTFSRKIIVLAHEKGFRDEIETVLAEVSTHVPLETEVHDHLAGTTPLMKIPVLIDGDLTLFDSRVIADYLDSFSDEPILIPRLGRARWLALKQQAIADGIMDAAILCRFELTKAPSRWPEWERAQKRRILQSLDTLQDHFSKPPAQIDIGAISAGMRARLSRFSLRAISIGAREDQRRSGSPASRGARPLSAGPGLLLTSRIRPSRAQGAQFKYKMGHPYPETLPIHLRAVDAGEKLKKDTGDRVEIGSS